MTAIAGVFRLDGRIVEAATLHQMVEPVRHRGSGEPSIHVSDFAGLAQIGMPATSPIGSQAAVGVANSGKQFAVFDGRLNEANHLRSQLNIRTDRPVHDVDLLLAAYEKWGESVPEHLSGDYSFTVFDASSGTLMAARDPIGTRMFNYYVTGNALYFATEIKQLIAISGVSAVLDEDMLGLFLCGAAQYGESTMYRQIKRLRGGYKLIARGRTVSTSSFWDMRNLSPIQHKDQREYAEHLREILIDSVSDNLRGEGPVTIELSGGLDSGSVACIAGAISTQHGRPLHAVYFQQSKPVFDELPYVEEICETYGIDLTLVGADEFWAMKPDLLAETRDEPFVVPFELLNQKAVKAAAAIGSRIVMTGEGGDEAFTAGYMLYLRDWLKHGRFLSIYRDLKNSPPEYRRAGMKYLRQHLMPSFARRRLGRYRTTVPPWLTTDFKNRTGLQQRLEATLGSSYMDRNYFTGRGSHPFHVLWDHRASSFGMEPSHPFWDRRVVEFLSLIPPAVRLQGGEEKRLLKQALQGIITPGLMNRRPFAAMESLFVRGWHEEAGRFFTNSERSPLQARGVIDASDVMTRYREYLSGDETKAARLFWTLVTEDWLLNRYPVIAENAGKAGTTP